MAVTKEMMEALALSEAEYEAIVERLGREPNELEVGLLGSLWSEHCGYKHSKPLLRMFTTESPRLLAALGAENAGAVDIGGGLAIVMKIESHNHPSAIEPYEGAATGVGGIVRDIFAMGARPIALLNSLRFGPPEEGRNRYLLEGVVAGIAGYGNCIGIPNVGGEIGFSPSYSDNPLVNAMCVGIVPKDRLVNATVGAPGNLLVLVGAETGRDGIHGASGLASRAFEDRQDLRPAVQVGNPFLEKVLMEACIEAARMDGVAGVQDLGAAGLSSASAEAADRAGLGAAIDVSKAPRRETAMTPYEVMLSESQERMLVVVEQDAADRVARVFKKWRLNSTVIGHATDDGMITVSEGKDARGALPVSLLTDPPQYRPQGVEPERQRELRAYGLDALPLPSEPPSEVLLKLLASPNVASKEWVYRQYDHHVMTNTVAGPGTDAAVLRIKGTRKGIALTTDGNGRYCSLDPYQGGMIAVAESCRNISTVGAEPIALTDCLNFGNPEKPDVYFQLEECVKGMAAASAAFGAPIISGNVSLYNETRGQGIYPTPIIGALGLLDDVTAHAAMAFRHEGDAVVLLGAGNVASPTASLSGSEYLQVFHDLVAGQPGIDLELEAAVQKCCRSAVREGLLKSAHDCSDGGLAVAIAESCIAGGVGVTIDSALSGRWDAALFGESQSRIVATVSQSQLPDLLRLCGDLGCPASAVGTVGGDSIRVGGVLDVSVADAAAAWRTRP